MFFVLTSMLSPLMNIKIVVFLHRIIKVDPIMYVNFVFYSIPAHLFEMMCDLYFSRCKLFNYKYVHNIITNIPDFNTKKNLSSFFSGCEWFPDVH